MVLQEKDLRLFIVEAKKNAYAAGAASGDVPSRPGAKNFPYAAGSYSYLDSYYGESDFAGQELVRRNGTPLWALNYYGTTLNPVDGFPEFLLECLGKVTEAAPFRGPEQYRDERFEYNCFWSGDISRFKGEERLLHRGEMIFTLTFHGGFIT
ncbi:DUF5680 domain-containing protein [Paenibacillus sp. 1P03SA]|uniref:DUF5680 domain-containing protein n=1 Tax=Paenibacillus sp. 1P03SA TaxID=3132294 RepID=UPI0039A1001B